MGKAYLVEHIVQRVGAVNGKADENQVSLWVGKRAKTVVFLLSGSVPQSQLYGLARRRVDGVGDVVFEDCRDVFLLLGGITVSKPRIALRRNFAPGERKACKCWIFLFRTSGK